jgi:hypothetical protein
VVGVVNKLLHLWIPGVYGESHSFDPAVIGKAAPVVQEVSKLAAIWAVEGALAGRHRLRAAVRLEAGDLELRRGQQVGDRRRAAGLA